MRTRKRVETKPGEKQKTGATAVEATEVKQTAGISTWHVLLFVSFGLFLIAFFLQSFSAEVPMARGWLLAFQTIILPNLFLTIWTENGPFTILDRVPVLLAALVPLLTIWSVGTLVVTRLRLRDRGLPGRRLFYEMVAGTAICSMLIAIFAMFGCLIWPVRLLSIFGILYALIHGGKYLWGARRPVRTGVFRLLRDRGILFFAISGILPVLLYLLGAMIPASEYDMLEYHLQGAREIYESGHLSFSEYNVYTNMPLGTEMFYVWGMVVMGNIFYGALAGKVVVATLALVTAWGIGSCVYSNTRNSRLSFAASVLYLAFPANYLVFSTGLNDGVLGLALLAGVLSGYELLRGDRTLGRVIFFALAVALAISVKYTAVVFVALPCSALLFYGAWKKRSAPMALVFVLVVLLVGGPWYVRNGLVTGNPVYPLAWSVFGDRTGTWTTEKNTRWLQAHHASSFTASDVLAKGRDVLLTGRDTAPVWGLTLIALSILIVRRVVRHTPTGSRRRTGFLIFLTCYLTLFVLIWFLATHRLDRFLVPAIPLVTILLTVAIDRCFDGNQNYLYRRTIAILGLAVLLLLGICNILQSGYATPLERLRTDPARFGDWSVWFSTHSEDFFNTNNESSGSVLLVAEANAFAFQVPIRYATCWDDSPIMPFLADSVQYDSRGQRIVAITNAAEIRQRLTDSGIRYILFNDAELQRFRSPGNYGFTNEEINLELFQLLERSGVTRRFEPESLPMETENRRTSVYVYEVL